MKNKNYYELLGVSEKATNEEIKIAYYQKVQEYHSDLNPNNPEATFIFQEINKANDTLSNPNKRELYNVSLVAPTHNSYQSNFQKKRKQQQTNSSSTNNENSTNKTKSTFIKIVEALVIIISFTLKITFSILLVILKSSARSSRRNSRRRRKW